MTMREDVSEGMIQGTWDWKASTVSQAIQISGRQGSD